MKKRSNNDNKSSKNRQNDDKGTNNDGKDKDKQDITQLNDGEAVNQGFGEWLRSNDGVEMMRLFVIANSLLIFITMAWPNMKETFNFIRDYFLGEEEDY